jgi:hypothetical protein
MCSRELDRPKTRLGSASLIVRLILYRDEVFRLPAASRWVQVASGVAWLTIPGKDILLKSGESTWLLTDREMILVSALGRVPLVLEVWGDGALSNERRLNHNR